MSDDGRDHERIAKLEARLDALDKYQRDIAETREKALELARTAEQRAIDIAAESVQERLNKVNEFREQLSDQATTFLPRQEYSVQHQTLIERLEVAVVTINTLRNDLSAIKGRTIGIMATLGLVVPLLVGLAILVVTRNP